MVKLLLSLFFLISLTACRSEENVEEPLASEENVGTDEFTREEMVEAQLPRLKRRSNREQLVSPLRAAFFEKSFMLVNVTKTEEEIDELPLLFAVHEEEVEITRVLPKEGRSPMEVEGTLISSDADFEVDTITVKVVDQSFANNILILTIETMDFEVLPIEFTQVANGIFVDEVGNKYRALSGVLEIAI